VVAYAHFVIVVYHNSVMQLLLRI